MTTLVWGEITNNIAQGEMTLKRDWGPIGRRKKRKKRSLIVRKDTQKNNPKKKHQ